MNIYKSGSCLQSDVGSCFKLVEIGIMVKYIIFYIGDYAIRIDEAFFLWQDVNRRGAKSMLLCSASFGMENACISIFLEH